MYRGYIKKMYFRIEGVNSMKLTAKWPATSTVCVESFSGHQVKFRRHLTRAQ